MEFIIKRASELDLTPPEFPKVVKRNGVLFLQLEDGREYEIPCDPIKTIGLLHHFAGKTWADHQFFFDAIDRIAKAHGWQIHPFQE